MKKSLTSESSRKISQLVTGKIERQKWIDKEEKQKKRRKQNKEDKTYSSCLELPSALPGRRADQSQGDPPDFHLSTQSPFQLNWLAAINLVGLCLCLLHSIWLNRMGEIKASCLLLCNKLVLSLADPSACLTPAPAWQYTDFVLFLAIRLSACPLAVVTVLTGTGSTLHWFCPLAVLSVLTG